MPFINLDNVNSGDRAITIPPSTTKYTPSEAVKGLLETEGTVFNIANMAVGMGKFQPEEGYDPFTDMKDYEGYAEDLSGAMSREHMAYLKNGIDDRKQFNEQFALADGWGKAAAIGSLIATDPLSLVPMGSAYKGVKAGETLLINGARTAAIGAAIETFNETILQAAQVERTAQTSFNNIASTTIVSWLLGGASGLLSQPELIKLSKGVERDMRVIPDSKMSTAGAAQVGTTFEEEEIKGLTKTKKVFEKIPSFMKNPLWELATSESIASRKLSEKLGDLSLVKNKNTKGIASEASVENLVKGYDAYKVPFYNAEKSLWQKYKERVKKEGIAPDQALGTGKGGMLTRDEFNEQVWWAGIKNDTHVIPEVEELAKTARREVFDPILKQTNEVGIFSDLDDLQVKTADSWMKRMYDREKILARRNEFKKIVIDDLREARDRAIRELEEARAITKTPTEELKKRIARLELRANTLDEELETTAEQLIDRVTNATNGRLQYDMKEQASRGGKQKMGARGSAKERVWMIKDEKIADYLVKDVRSIVDSHIRTMSPDIEIMRKFGTLDVDVIKKQIQDDYNILRNRKVKDAKTGEMRPQTNEELNKLTRQLAKDEKNVEALYEKLRGIYAQPDDYTAPIHVLERTALALNYVRLLGDVVASSVPDLGRVVMVHGFERSYGKLLKSAMKDMKGLKLAKEDILEIGTALDLTNSMTTLARNNMDEWLPPAGKIDAATQKVSAFASTINGMNVWTSGMKTFTGIVTQNRMLEGIEKWATGGKLSQKEIENLASHGIDQNLAKRISAQFKKYGETRDILRVANARDWDDIEAKNLFRAAIRKQIDEIIVTPGLDKPLWMSRAGWRTIGQFKSFAFSSTQRVLLAGMQQADANVYSGAVMMTFLGAMTYGWKSMLSGRDPSDDPPRVWIKEGVDRSGVLGIFADVNNITEKLTRGTVGISALTGGHTMSRYANRNLAGTLLGPSFGLAQDVFQVTGSAFAGEVKETDIHKLRQLLPFQNIPYLRGLFDAGEDGINSLIGTK
ncbi:structural protein [Caudoviricetes sp.]|nr:structural protein [Caudoviricetes sp.]